MLEQLLVRAGSEACTSCSSSCRSTGTLVGDRFDYAVEQYRGPVAGAGREYDVPYLDFNAA